MAESPLAVNTTLRSWKVTEKPTLEHTQVKSLTPFTNAKLKILSYCSTKSIKSKAEQEAPAYRMSSWKSLIPFKIIDLRMTLSIYKLIYQMFSSSVPPTVLKQFSHLYSTGLKELKLLDTQLLKNNKSSKDTFSKTVLRLLDYLNKFKIKLISQMKQPTRWLRDIAKRQE